MSELPSHPPDGRPLSWRVGMLLGAALLGGAGYAILRWPQIIEWCVSGVFFALAAFLTVSALLARGRRR